jgi:glutamate/tyrosine decarboxylase-like PLP-dependent enzyme
VQQDPLELDPQTMRELAHRTIDFLLDWVGDADAPPLRRATPAEMRERLSAPAPEAARPFDELLAQLGEDVLPFASRTGHPRFFAFVPGGGTWPGALADLVAAACNVYAGAWMESAGPAQVELEVLSWFKQWLGFPEEAAGTLLSGGSVANLTALAAARESVGGTSADGLVLYVADQAHSSIARSARLLGLRREQVRVIPVGESFTLRPALVARAMDADVAAGRRPFAVCATAGATNTGAVDPLAELAELCEQRGVWLHVDAAYGAFAVLTQRGRAQLAGIERADSITLDPHKWLYQPYECGCVLVRDGDLLHDAFTIVPDYLRDARPRDGEVNFSELGLQLTRSWRALKVWLSVQTFGVAAFRTAVDRSLDLAAHAHARVQASDALEVLAPPSLGVVCFRRRFGDADGEELDGLNAGLVAALERSGLGLVSSTRIRGRYAIRMCILNHATTLEDVDLVLDFLETAEPLAADEGFSRYERDESVGAATGIDFLDRGREVAFAAGETIVERWDTSRDFYVVVDGTVEVSIEHEPVRELGSGDYFGELAAMDWGAGFAYSRLATIRARTPVRAVAFDCDTLAQLLRERPAFERELRRRAGDRLLRH